MCIKILKKNNREDVDYESIINNIFTTYLLNIELRIRNICIFISVFILTSSMELLSSILKPEELIDLMESLKMKKEIDSKKYYDLSSDIEKIEDVKLKLDGWLQKNFDPAQSESESEKNLKRERHWKEDLDNFSGKY